MAQDRNIRTLQFTAVGAGATAVLPHGLVSSQGALRPDFAIPNAGGFSVTYDATNLTVVNTGGSAASVGVLVSAVWSGARELGGDADLSIQPFIGFGGGGGSSAPQFYTAAIAGLVSDWNGTTGTLNTTNLQASYATMTTLKRAMYAPGQYNTDGTDVTAGQHVHIWGDGQDSESQFKLSSTGATGIFVHGDTLGGRLRIEDQTITGNAAAGPSYFAMLYLEPGVGQIEARRINFNGVTRFNAALVPDGKGRVLTEDCYAGPNISRAIRNEGFGGECGDLTINRWRVDAYDFCFDLASRTTANITQCEFIASRDVGAGSIGINAGNAGPFTASPPDHYRVSESRFHPEVLWHLTRQGPFLAEYSRNSHTLGAGGYGVRAGSNTVIAGGIFTSTAYVSWIASAPYLVGQFAFNGTRLYVVTTAGTAAGAGGPTGTGTGIVDGTVVWNFVKAIVVTLGGFAYSAVDADIATYQIDGNLGAGNEAVVTAHSITFQGISAANIQRGTDAGTRVWRFSDCSFENYADFANNRYNVVQAAGEIDIDNAQFLRAPHGGASGAAYISGGTHRLRSSAVRDGDYIVDAQVSNVELHVEACYVSGTIQLAPAAANTISVYGWQNEFPTSGGFVGSGDLTKIRGYVQPRRNKGPDQSIALNGGATLLGYANADHFDVTDSGTYTDMIANIGFMGPWYFRATNASGFIPTVAGNIKFLKPGVAGVHMAQWNTLIMERDPVDQKFYQIG